MTVAVLLAVGIPPDDRLGRVRGLCRELLELLEMLSSKPRLAEAGVANDADHLRPPASRTLEARLQLGKLLIPTDQRRLPAG